MEMVSPTNWLSAWSNCQPCEEKILVFSCRCPVVDSVYADANKVYENYNSTTLKVGFRSFTWTNNVPYLHIHCKYSICDFSVNASCRIQVRRLSFAVGIVKISVEWALSRDYNAFSNFCGL